MRLAHEIEKPEPWVVDSAFTPPEYEGLWESLVLALPIWDARGRALEDVAGHGLHAIAGTLIDPVSSWTTGPYGPQVSLIGQTQSRFVVADPASNLLDGCDRLSIEVIFRPTNLSSIRGIVGKYSPLTARRGWRLQTSGTEIQLQVSSDGSGNESQTTVGANLIVGVWYHVVVTFSSGVFRAYVDGASKTTDGDFSSHLSIFAASNDLLVGQREDAVGLIGDLAGIRIWQRALSAADVALLREDPWGMYRRPGYGAWAHGEGSVAPGPWSLVETLDGSPSGAVSYPISGLEDGRSYDVMVRTIDTTGNRSDGCPFVAGVPGGPIPLPRGARPGIQGGGRPPLRARWFR